MARQLSTARSSSVPYLAAWTAAGVDYTSAAANAPVLLNGLDGEQYLNLSFSGETTALTLVWHLTLVDFQNQIILRTIRVETTATLHRSAIAGAAGHYLHGDKIIDIGGEGSRQNDGIQWCLAAVDFSTETSARLVSYKRALHPA